MIRELKFSIASGQFVNPACVGTAVKPANQHHMVGVTIKPGLDPKFDAKAFPKSGWFGVGGNVCK
jgi:hypothetical protein